MRMSPGGFIAGPDETPDNRAGTTGTKLVTDHLEKEKQTGKIALTQLTSLDGVIQSPGHTDVPFKYRGPHPEN